MSEAAPVKVEAHHIRAALRLYYPPPRCAVAFEVAQGTGLRAHRHLDAIAMDLWPSHGHNIHGIEIKVSRHDWRRELKDPAKAEELAQFCDFFWIAAPDDVVPIAELPPAWGLLEYKDGKVRQRKGADRTPAKAIDRHFFAAMFRAATQSMTVGEAEALLKKERETMRENNRQAIEREVTLKTQANLEDANKWRRLVEAVGEGAWSADDKRMIEAYHVIRKAGLLNTDWHNLTHIAKTLEDAAKRVRDAMAPFTVEKAAE